MRKLTMAERVARIMASRLGWEQASSVIDEVIGTIVDAEPVKAAERIQLLIDIGKALDKLESEYWEREM